MLAERVEELEKGKESRVAVVGETKKKRKSSAVKKSKRKYKLLEAAKSQAMNEKGDEGLAETNDGLAKMDGDKTETAQHLPPPSGTP
jgi:hypothetical protein